jgi:threonine dehydrogenase-like Zn-dependent dehydrogenase
MPTGIEPMLGIFARIGSIALNGVHDGRVRVGETVAVVGLGVLGQIVAQLARLAGARVIGADLHAGRRALAGGLGTSETMDPADGRLAEQVRGLTDGRGADVVIEATGSGPALHEAIRCAAYSSRVVALGFIPGEASGLFLGEEFHHNRINLVCSQISGTDPEIGHRWNALRLAQTVMRLQGDGLLHLVPLISHVRPFADAPGLFRLLDEAPADIMQSVLSFESEGTFAPDTSPKTPYA